MSESIQCPHCGEELPELASRLALLEELNRLLSENRELLLRRSGETHHSPLIASRFRPHFHKPDCTWMENAAPENIIEFFSHHEAVDAGYKPCKTCRA